MCSFFRLIEGVFCRIGQHELKLFSVVVSPGLGPVGIDLHNGQPVGGGKPLGLRNLSLNGLLALSVTGKTGIDNSVHTVSPFTKGRSRAIRTMFLDFRSARS